MHAMESIAEIRTIHPIAGIGDAENHHSELDLPANSR